MKAVEVFVDATMDILFIMFALMVSAIMTVAISGITLLIIQ